MTLSSPIYESYRRHAVRGMLKVAWEALVDFHAAELENDGTENEEGRKLCENSERNVTLALWVHSAKTPYLAARKMYFLKHTQKRPEADLGFFVASCQTDKRMFRRLM